METTACGEAWESVVGDLRLRRTVEPADGDQVLVRMTFENEGTGRIATRVVEDVPGEATDLSVITTAAGDPRTFSHVGDWTVHEVTVPSGKRRTTAYLLGIDAESPALATPRVKHVQPVDDGRDEGTPLPATVPPKNQGVVATTSAPDEERTDGTSEPSVHGARTDGAPVDDGTLDRVRIEDSRTDHTEGSEDRESDGEPTASERPEDEDRTATDLLDEASVVDALLAELSAEPDGERRARLRAELGVSPADEARFRHLQSRLDDLAAYVDALEALVDDHGIDAIDAMDDRIAENAERTTALDEELSDLADGFERHRSRTAEELGELRADLAERGAQLDERLADVEETLAVLESDVRELQMARETDRQVHGLDLRRVEQSLADLDATVDRLESDVDEFEAFQQRFRAAFASDQRPGTRSPTEHGDASDGDRGDASDGAAGKDDENGAEGRQ